MNFLCSIGIYWGRYIRLNSWDILTKPEVIAQHTLETVFNNEFAHTVIGVYFVVITAMYFLLKAVDLAVWEYWHRHRLAGRFPISPPPESNRLHLAPVPPIRLARRVCYAYQWKFTGSADLTILRPSQSIAVFRMR